MAPDSRTLGFDYPALMRRSLAGLVRDLLRHVAEQGFPGEHHFYLTFRTDAPGVVLSAGQRQRFPKEMTIVLQHQYWGLEVEDEAFSVTLRFGGAPERLTVPFEALSALVDPSAGFGLRLDAPSEKESEAASEGSIRPEGPGATIVPFRPRSAQGQEGEDAP